MGFAMKLVKWKFPKYTLIIKKFNLGILYISLDPVNF